MNKIEELKKLKSLLEQGAISEEEFLMRKKEIIEKENAQSAPDIIKQEETIYIENPNIKEKEVEINTVSASSNINPVDIATAGNYICKGVNAIVLELIFGFIGLFLIIFFFIDVLVNQKTFHVDERVWFGCCFLFASFICFLVSLDYFYRAGSYLKKSNNPPSSRSDSKSSTYQSQNQLLSLKPY